MAFAICKKNNGMVVVKMDNGSTQEIPYQELHEHQDSV